MDLEGGMGDILWDWMAIAGVILRVESEGMMEETRDTEIPRKNPVTKRAGEKWMEGIYCPCCCEKAEREMKARK